MTLKTFFARARKVKWIVNEVGEVRTAREVNSLARSDLAERIDNHCPLSYVVGSWWPFGKDVGLADETITKIMNAADRRDNANRPWLRRQLGIRA